jgi:glycosyltransferase involved in cell wall biosynthesis
VVAEHFGIIGGGAKAPLLLARELSHLGFRVSVFTASLLFADSLPPAGMKVHTPAFNRGWRFRLPLRLLARRVRREIRRCQPDLVFVCGVTPLAHFLLKSDIAGQLLVWEFSNATPGNALVDWQAAGLLHACRAVLSPSASVDAQIRKNYGYGNGILRLPFWIEPIALDRVGDNPFVWDFVYLGRRDPEKGLFELVRATAVLAQSKPDLQVLIAGPGSAVAYQELAEQLGIAKNIEFRFFASELETMEALANSRYLVLPSYHEGYPLVLLEAGSYGIPFIATDVGSVAEMLAASDAGWLLPPRDTGALASLMQQALSEDPGRYRERSLAARRFFERLSSSEQVRSNLTGIVRECIN